MRPKFTLRTLPMVAVVGALGIGLSPTYAAAQSTMTQSNMQTTSADSTADQTLPSYTEQAQKLVDATDNLRSAVHKASEHPGSDHDAIQAIDQALKATQQALFDLPYDQMFTKKPKLSQSASMDRLTAAADDLRKAAHAMADAKPGQQLQDAVKQVNVALLQTNEAMGEVLAANNDNKK